MSKQVKWSIDIAHSSIYFKVKHLMITNIVGSFKAYDATISTTGLDFTTSDISVWIDVDSISTGDNKRDDHLRSNEFLDTKKHKQITFLVNSISEESSNNIHELWGELTMVGITKNVKLECTFNGTAKDAWNNEKAGFELSGKINRSDWGLTWNAAIEAGGLVVSDEVTINCEIQLHRV